MAEIYDTGEEDSKVVQLRNPEAYQRKWLREIEKAQKVFKTWETKGETIIKLYRKQTEQTATKRKFAMLWANTQVLMPTLYARVPEPIVGRRFKDKDVPGRLASEMMERAALYLFETSDFDACMRGARDDVLLPGRGSAWVRFIEDGVIALDYVHWRDFLHEPARRWEEVTWVAKRSYLPKDQLQERFKLSAEALKDMKPDNVPKSNISEEDRKVNEGKYTVWEIWDKSRKRVCFICPTAKQPLEEGEPFVNLDGFWPCPRPIYSTMTTDSLIPVPDYKYYQDQAEEIDDLTRRIASLTDSLKLVGFYPGGSEASTEIEKALMPGVENRMIKVESWAAFAEKGGVKAIVFLPIQEVVETIKACVELRRELINDVYQITGISDIMRGATDPNETLGAQQLKAQSGSVRIRDRQQDIQRFARDMLKIMCEIIAEKFSPQVLLQMTNMATPENDNPDTKQAMGEAFALMKSDRLRGFRIDIETDSTMQPDENAEKERRVEFTTALGGFFKEAIPMVQQVPEMLPLVGEVLRFTVRGFRAGKQLEDVVDKTLASLEQKAQQASQKPPEPTPDQMKLQIETKRIDEVEKPKAMADAALAGARARHINTVADLEPQKLALQQDEMILGDDQKMADRELKGIQFDKSQGQDADQFAATQAADQQASQAAAMGGGEAMAPAGPQGPAPGPVQAPAGKVGQLLQGMTQAMAQLAQLIAQSSQANADAINDLAQVMAQPTQVETPRGTYMARKVMN